MNTFTLQNLLSSLLQTPEDTNLELNFTFTIQFNKANKLHHLSSRDLLFDFHRRQGDLPAIKEK